MNCSIAPFNQSAFRPPVNKRTPPARRRQQPPERAQPKGASNDASFHKETRSLNSRRTGTNDIPAWVEHERIGAELAPSAATFRASRQIGGPRRHARTEARRRTGGDYLEKDSRQRSATRRPPAAEPPIDDTTLAERVAAVNRLLEQHERETRRLEIEVAAELWKDYEAEDFRLRGEICKAIVALKEADAAYLAHKSAAIGAGALTSQRRFIRTVLQLFGAAAHCPRAVRGMDLRGLQASPTPIA